MARVLGESDERGSWIERKSQGQVIKGLMYFKADLGICLHRALTSLEEKHF